MQRTANPRTPVQFRPRPPVPGRRNSVLHAGIAQLVEHDLAKVGVASSSLVSRSMSASPGSTSKPRMRGFAVSGVRKGAAFQCGASEAGYPRARMAKLVDASDLKSAGRKAMPVRFRLRAPQCTPRKTARLQSRSVCRPSSSASQSYAGGIGGGHGHHPSSRMAACFSAAVSRDRCRAIDRPRFSEILMARDALGGQASLPSRWLRRPRQTIPADPSPTRYVRHVVPSPRTREVPLRVPQPPP